MALFNGNCDMYKCTENHKLYVSLRIASKVDGVEKAKADNITEKQNA